MRKKYPCESPNYSLASLFGISYHGDTSIGASMDPKAVDELAKRLAQETPAPVPQEQTPVDIDLDAIRAAGL